MGAYDLDFHAWAFEQAEALRRRSANEIDWENLAEEILSLGKQQRWELYNRLVVLLTHLLKWEFQADRRGRSWTAAIVIQRRDIARLLADNPSLRAAEDETFGESYLTARQKASGETDLDVETFPQGAPFTLAQALDPAWLPGDAGGDQSATGSKGS